LSYGKISDMSNKEKKVEKKNLPDERYDEKLFKQAYKAAKEAREVEKKTKQKKSFLKISLLISIPLVVISITLLLLSFVKPKSEYIETGIYPKDTYLVELKQTDVRENIEKEVSDISISALSGLVFNPQTGDILFEKEIHERRYIASLTKILTAIVVLETFPLDEVIEVSRENIPEGLSWQLGLKNGEKISVENLFKAMIMSSYNDTAYIFANAYTKEGYGGFIKAMNSKAQSLRMFDSEFSNPAGIDQEGNFSTAWDVAMLISGAQNYKEIVDTVSLGSYTVNWSSGDEVISKKIFTTNQLYGVNPYSKGFKTGITDLAKQCFAGYFEYPNGKSVMTIVLGSEDRFTDTVKLERYSRGLLR